MQKPTTLYHIAEKHVWEQQEHLDAYTPEAFAEEGFVHCSTAEQLLGTANRFYQGRTDLVLLKLKAPSDVVYENLEGGKTLFPHIYNPLSKGIIIEVTALKPQKNGHFEA